MNAKRKADIAEVTGNIDALVKRLRVEESKLATFVAYASEGEVPHDVVAKAAHKTFKEAMARQSLLNVPSLLKLRKFDTPTISNGLEMITRDPDYGWKGFNLETVWDHMPDWGTMVGYVVTCKIQPSNRRLVVEQSLNRQRFADYVADLPSALPKIIVVEDLDVTQSARPRPYVYGSMWGEVNANFFSKLGVQGCITDGAVRDIPEMKAAGFRALSRTICPSHSFGGVPLEWDVPIEVFGTSVLPGQLIAADRHGFQVIPEDLEAQVLEAASDGDKWERDFTIAASLSGDGSSSFREVNERMRRARQHFSDAKTSKYGTFEERMPGGQEWAKQ